MKKQINSLKLILRAKEEENTLLKQNKSYTKYSALENEYHQKLEEFSYMKQHNEFLQQSVQE